MASFILYNSLPRLSTEICRKIGAGQGQGAKTPPQRAAGCSIPLRKRMDDTMFRLIGMCCGEQMRKDGENKSKTISTSVGKKLEKFLDDESFSLKGRAATHIGEDGFRYYEAYFRDIDGENYKVRFSAGLNGQEETVYSIGKIEKRRPSIPNRGSSSQREALKTDQRPSGLIMRTSGGKVKKKNPLYKLLLKKRCKRKTGYSAPNGTGKRTIQHRYSRIPNCQIHRNVVK